MMKSHRYFLIAIISLIPLLISCHSTKDEGITMSVSILPQKFWVDRLTNSQVNVNCLLPPGSNPATYNPTPKQMTLMDQSVYYFYIDELGFEDAWLPKFKVLNETTMFLNTTAGITRLKGHYHGDGGDKHESDPHLWVSPKRAKTMVDIIYTMLGYSELFSQPILDANYRDLTENIDYLDSLYTDAAQQATNKTFVIYHPALSYLAHDYGFEQISIEKDGKEPTAAHVRAIIDTMKAKHIKYIFIQKQFDKSKAQLIADETGAELIEIDPLGYEYYIESKKLAAYLKAH